MAEVIKVEDCGSNIGDYDIPIHNAIIVPNNATVGDMIKAMFPDCEQKRHINNGYFEMYFDKDLRDASYMRVSKEFWNAPYKREKMGMSIDEAIEHGKEQLEIFDGVHKEFIEISIDTMRKYQKIEQIIDDYDLEAWEVLEKIKEVVKK